MWDAVNDEKRMEPNRIGQRVDKHKNNLKYVQVECKMVLKIDESKIT